MRTVWKFPLPLDDRPHPLPGVVRAAAAGPLADRLTVWVEADTDFPLEPRASYQIFGTGHEVPDDARWVATVSAPPFVWHVFEVDAHAVWPELEGQETA